MNFIVELEELETNEKQIVFHGYTSNDLFDKVVVTLICMYMIGSTMIAIANKISK